MRLEKINKFLNMKTILITGASSGLGLMLSRHYDERDTN